MMKPLLMFLVGLLSLAGLWGCKAPVAPVAPATASVEARLQWKAPYRTQALVTPYALADVDHVRLTLLKASGGTYSPTGAAPLRLAGVALQAPVHLGALKMASSYRILAEAFSSADESASLISDPAQSVTDFQTPQLTFDVLGVAAIDDAPSELVALNIRLRDRTYAGQATFTLSIGPGFTGKNAMSQVRVTLSQKDTAGALTTCMQRTIPLSQANGTFTVTNLRYGQAYRLQSEGLGSGGKVVSKASVSFVDFQTPALSPGGVEDDMGAKVVPVRRW